MKFTEKINKQLLKNYFLHLPRSIFWNFVNFYPSKGLKIIGVTGTDGKTTTSNMIYHILNESGYKVGMVSTIGAKYAGKELETGFHVTSPDPRAIQSFLKQMLVDGIEVVVLETTSHALDQFRYFGIKFDIAVYTNITHEHLDYHGNYDKYVEAKLKLIDNLKPDGIVIGNLDDKSIEYIKVKSLKKWSENTPQHLKIYGMYDKVRKQKYDMLGIENVKTTNQGISFYVKSVLTDGKNNIKALKCDVNILGDYNAYNCAAAILASIKFSKSKISISDAIKAMSTFETLKGRMQVMQNGDDKKPTIIVDFAHTPNALEKALSTLKKIPHNKLYSIFGTAGLRDVSKRPMMGEIAARYSDVVILVPEDPRTVAVKEINDQIMKGIDIGIEKYKKKDLVTLRYEEANVESRVSGIRKAIEMAGSNDIIVICGKGHENSLCFGTTEYEYSDQATVLKLLSK